MNQKYHEFYRGEIYYADMNNIFAGRTSTMQPVLVLLTDQGIYDTPTVLVAEACQYANPAYFPMESAEFLLEKAYPIDKRRLRRRAGRLTTMQMEEIDAALRSNFYLEDGDYLPLEVGAP